MSTRYDPAEDGAQMAFDGRMSYGDYLRIDQILNAQHLLTSAHDEMLFIIQHQTSELWMRLALHETRRRAAGHCRRPLRPRPSRCCPASRASSSSSTTPGTCCAR